MNNHKIYILRRNMYVYFYPKYFIFGGKFFSLFITKTCLYNFDPLKPHFYIVKLRFTGYTLFFLFLLKSIDCGYSLEPPPKKP